MNTTSCVLSQISEPSLGAAALPIAQPQQQHPRVLFWVSPFLHAHQKSSHGQTARPIALQDVEVNDEVQQESLRVGSRWVFSCLFDTCLIGSKAKSQILDKTSLSRLRRGCQEPKLVLTAAKSTCSLSHPGPTPPWANLSLFSVISFFCSRDLAEFEQPWLTGPFWWELCGVCCWGFVHITGGFESGTKQPVIKNGYCTFEAKIRTLSVMTEAAKSRSFHLKPSLRLLGKNAKKKNKKTLL